MRVLFIQDNIINESLILMELSAYLKMHGHQTFLLVDREERRLEKEITTIKPDIFIIPCYQFSLLWVLKVAERIRAVSDKKIALAGITPTLLPNIINNLNVDLLLRGEIEETTLEVLTHLKDDTQMKKIKNLVIKNNGVILINPLRKPYADLDELPLPDRELYYNRYNILRDIGLKRFISGRGCINNCSFCYNSSFKKIYSIDNADQSFIRRKSPQRIIEEIKYVKLKYPLNHVHFSDDLFCINEEWIESFSESYRRYIDIPFTCNAAVDLLNEKIIKKLKEANCKGVAIGIETENEKLRSRIMNKKITNVQIKEIAAIIKKYKLKLITFNMIANPAETPDSVIKTIKLNQEIKTDCVRVTLPEPIPYTTYAKIGIEEGFFTENELLEFFTTSVLYPKNKDRVFFQAENKKLWLRLYYLFHILVKLPLLNNYINKLINLPENKFLDKLLKLMQLLRLLDERKVFGINYKEAVQYYLHAGDPYKNRKNVHPSLV